MPETWKSVLYEYVRNRNQVEIDFSIKPLLTCVSDETYIAEQTKRLKQLSEWHHERQVRPIRSETRVRLNKIFENEHRVSVEMEFKKQRSYSSGQLEERIEQERVTLKKVANQWTISKIEAAIPERQACRLDFFPHNANSRPYSSAGTQSSIHPQSTPYLNQQIFTSSEISTRSYKYDRLKVQQYADTWWNSANPNFIEFDVDCTNYVSQCLYAGGIPMNYTGRRESGWWYKGKSHNQELWSFSWSISHSLQWYLSNSRQGLQAQVVDSPAKLTIGDVIAYDWDGDSRFQHSTIVTGIDASGNLLVNAHTSNSKHRYWDYRDSYAWNENTKYRFFHILDSV